MEELVQELFLAIPASHSVARTFPHLGLLSAGNSSCMLLLRSLQKESVMNSWLE